MLNDPVWAKENLPSAADVYLGHLRYGTFGGDDIEYVQPIMRENNWKSRNLILAGNFNMTNVDELFKVLIELGQHPKEYSDTVTCLEKVGHFLDEENARRTVESGLDRIIISIDGTSQDVYEQYRRERTLDSVLEGTQNLVKWKRKLKSASPHIIFQFLVWSYNYILVCNCVIR